MFLLSSNLHFRIKIVCTQGSYQYPRLRKSSESTRFLQRNLINRKQKYLKADALIEKVKQGDLEDENGFISRDDFVALSLHNNLLKIKQRKLLENIKRKKSESAKTQNSKADPREKPPSCFCFNSISTELGMWILKISQITIACRRRSLCTKTKGSNRSGFFKI